ncbi:6-phosphogluconolactonase [uncultured Sunxiuqinia sp.]|uniref:6-phosphogluconolactonase n=1 Tax=uncultured Sunxiuqinia sp. TaxID=1573825 RepID=UPI00261AD037|nr:6-phosphogluconolactonase [uncultured Sunxiuqinia sp.]
MTSSREIKIFSNARELAEAFAQELYETVKNTSQRFDIALSGGSTPKLLFEVLARSYASKMPWERVHFWWGDERCVPPTSEESNYGMTQKHLLSKVNLAENQVHRVKGELNPEEATRDYIDEIKSNLKERDGWPVFDLIILGMGDDGHTASIFPHEMNLLKSNQVCEVATHPVSGQKRVSLTGKTINNADRIYFLISGKAKASRMAEIINNTEEANKLPTTHIQVAQGSVTFFLDQDAASEIENN